MQDDREPNSFLSSDDNLMVATLETAPEMNLGAPEWTGPRCDKCSAPIKSDGVAICRRCGWYASLGTHVEIDPNWDNETDEAESTVSEAQPSHLQVWLNMLPRWSWVILASAMVIVVESVVARFVTPEGSSERTLWSLGQLAIGLLAFVGCHIFNFLALAADDADFGMTDLFLKPIKLWSRAVQHLPKRLLVVNTAVCGVVAAIMSVVVIGGIPYERLWDWGFKEPVKQNLMGAVMDRVKELDSRNGADNLEDAIGDFAGQGAVGSELPAPPPKPREKADCVILGYVVDRDGRLATLFLGTAHGKSLIYAGQVTPEMPEEERMKMLHDLESIKTLRPFISIPAEATWVKPQLTCRITFGERQKGGRLIDLRWDQSLGNMEMSK